MKGSDGRGECGNWKIGKLGNVKMWKCGNSGDCRIKTQTSACGGSTIQKRGSGVPWLATVAVSLQTA